MRQPKVKFKQGKKPAQAVGANPNTVDGAENPRLNELRPPGPREEWRGEEDTAKVHPTWTQQSDWLWEEVVCSNAASVKFNPNLDPEKNGAGKRIPLKSIQPGPSSRIGSGKKSSAAMQHLLNSIQTWTLRGMARGRGYCDSPSKPGPREEPARGRGTINC